MLSRQKSRRNKHRDLLAGVNRFKGRAESNLGFAKADVPADETVHDFRRFHIVLYLIHDFLLVGREFIRELPFKLSLQVIVFREREAAELCSRPIKSNQAFGKLVDLFLNLPLLLFPISA